MSDRLRSRGHALAACSYLALSFLFAVDEQIFPSVLFGIAAIGAFDAAMYVYEVRTGDRQDPKVAELAKALAAVRPDAEAAVNRSAELAAEYLDRALRAEAAVTRADEVAAEWSRREDLPAILSICEAVSDLREALHPTPEPPPCLCTFSERCAQCPPEDDVPEHDDPGPESPDEPTEDPEDVEHRALASRRQPGYDAVYAYIRSLPGERSRLEDVVRNAQIWRAVEAALDALNVGRCVSSHCVENGHIIPVATEPEEATP
jgi:hypothetical protein